MLDTSTTLIKIFAWEFFRLHAGFFLVLITLTFGFMSEREHQALAQFFIASNELILIPVSIWVVYAIKVIVFNQQRLRLIENQFVFDLELLPERSQWLSLLPTLTAQMLPVIAYACFLLMMAVRQSQLQVVPVIISAVLGLIAISAALIRLAIKTPKPELRISMIKNWIDISFRKPLWNMYLTWLLRKEPFVLIGTKIFSCFLIFAVAQLYHAEPYDWRLIGMGVCIASLGNFMIVLLLQTFDHHDFQMVKSLPVALWRRWFIIVTVLLVLFVPELAILFNHFPTNLTLMDFTWLATYVLGTIIMMLGLSQIPFDKPEYFNRSIFSVTVITLVVMLFSVPVHVIALLNGAAGYWLFAKNYHRFEVPEITE